MFSCSSRPWESHCTWPTIPTWSPSKSPRESTPQSCHPSPRPRSSSGQLRGAPSPLLPSWMIPRASSSDWAKMKRRPGDLQRVTWQPRAHCPSACWKPARTWAARSSGGRVSQPWSGAAAWKVWPATRRRTS
uniref:Macaca fascicularis brain cDNA clone: QflA-19466, similar to human endoglin (Osler-Rendu-Weber syndrome 1) (ENG), mRNA, RefSeq: NM_000118.1 n=1 Tax=Macaca fascicularis TaxID=9541 RepID=I7GCK5_MACFA|nr:unnamed protein product [Macaca fascicularis]